MTLRQYGDGRIPEVVAIFCNACRISDVTLIEIISGAKVFLGMILPL
jgi:hypothetical protein